MANFKDLFQVADWKQEKHVPVIEVPERIKKGEIFQVKVSIGKEIAHPNKTERHIRWMTIYFHPQGEKFPYQIGQVTFTAHGESVEGPDTSTIYTHHEAILSFKTDKSGTIHATSYCNIHGLWQNYRNVELE